MDRRQDQDGPGYDADRSCRTALGRSTVYRGFSGGQSWPPEKPNATLVLRSHRSPGMECRQEGRNETPSETSTDIGDTLLSRSGTASARQSALRFGDRQQVARLRSPQHQNRQPCCRAGNPNSRNGHPTENRSICSVRVDERRTLQPSRMAGSGSTSRSGAVNNLRRNPVIGSTAAASQKRTEEAACSRQQRSSAGEWRRKQNPPPFHSRRPHWRFRSQREQSDRPSARHCRPCCG